MQPEAGKTYISETDPTVHVHVAAVRQAGGSFVVVTRDPENMTADAEELDAEEWNRAAVHFRISPEA